MKKFMIACGLVLSITTVIAQQKEGKIIYEKISQFRARFTMNGVENDAPQTRKDNFELTFANNQSLWKIAEKENDITNDGGAMVMLIIPGNDDILYNNFTTGKKVDKKDLLGKTFIIDDTISTLKWKVTSETKEILGLPCIKAVATDIRKRTTMNMENGKMERKEIDDTSNIVAWFTSSIPVAAGPAEYQGQLPGLILEMDVKNGTQVFKATSISEKADIATIKEPTGKKRYTPEEYKKEREKLIEEMNRNNQGRGPGLRIN